MEGSFAIRRRRPDACLIFIDAPLDELDRRLKGRATEMAGEIEMRLAIANAQRRERTQFDHVILNDDAGRAAGRALRYDAVGDLPAGRPTVAVMIRLEAA